LMLAKEIGFSETAFLLREKGGYRLRWFTPKVEVGLCGHATLASAHALWESGSWPAARPVRFRTLNGDLIARRDGKWIELDFPSLPPLPEAPPPGLFKALRLKRSPGYFGTGPYAYLLELPSEEAVRSLRPDFRALARYKKDVAVTAASRRKRCDFVSRYFAPAQGVDEDPVTGSAHCMLGPFWGKRLGKAGLRAWQASERGGEVRVRLAGSRVLLRGRALTVLTGALS
ncbi:MAG: PhzF family phenazine biosynthesis protein, partial [Elusimicrobiota bacterium]